MGAFSLRSAVVPLAGALLWGSDVVVAHDRDTVLGAPPVDVAVSLVPDDEARLARALRPPPDSIHVTSSVQRKHHMT